MFHSFHRECLRGHILCSFVMPIMRRKAVFFCLLPGLLAPAVLFSAPLTEARVTKIVNDVKLIDPAAADRDAKLNDVVRNDVALTTGIKSRSELLFQDNTLTRLGPESYFSFKAGTRDMTLQKGTLLLQVPKGMGGAKIHTAAVTAAITGTTIMVEYLPQKTLKVLVLEGNLRLSINGRFGDSLLLQPGRMVIMSPNAKRIPDPVTVDLKKVIRTSALVNMRHGKKTAAVPLPSMRLIEHEVDRQQQSKDHHRLVDTNLIILGKGTDVLLGSTDLLQYVANRNDVAKISGSILPPPGPPPPPPPIADIGPSPTFKVHGEGDAPRTEERYGSDHHPVASPLVINTAQDFSLHGGTGSITIVSNDSVTVNSSLKVSDATSHHGHAEISINSGKATGPAISITSSAQLLALLAGSSDKHDKITFQSAGGDIDVSGATIQVSGGTIDVRNNGPTGVVTLNNATLNADTIKVGALGDNGTLNVGGGTISANTIINLYAGGSNGTVNFTEDVTLNGNSVKTIAGDTVTIFNGKVVTVNGPAPAQVFTNNPNYTGSGGNASTTGTFAGQGATTQPLSAKPGF
jgi:hypothetical protein